MPDTPASIRVLMICTGVGIMNRGIETFFRECFDGLRRAEGLDLRLVKGAGADADREERVWCLPRTGRTAQRLGRAIRRNGYVVEQLSSFLPVARRIRRHRPDIVFYSDVNLAMRLHRFRRTIGVPYRLVYSNGAPLQPPFLREDHVQQLAPYYLERALAAGEPPTKHSLVPYGIRVPPGSPVRTPAAIGAARARLRLPADRQIVLSVGWIAPEHKRMDYVVREVACLPGPRPFLVLLGTIDDRSPPVLRLAERLLGPDGFVARSEPYELVADYYLSADAFTLASLQEGFGRVYLEALIHGLPCAVHDHPVMRYVLGEEGTFADLTRPGGLAPLLASLLRTSPDPAAAVRRRESVRRRFSWESLTPAYVELFRTTMRNSPAPF